MEKLRKYGLIGYPVSHSYSPSMHNAAFKHLRLNARYDLFEVKPEELEEFLKEFPSKLSGCNVTIPHKITARDFIEREGTLTEDAQKIGAVNTIVVRNSKLTGDNTDGKGFMESLRKDLSFDPKDKAVCMVGTGGAALSIIMQLGNLPKKIYVIGIIKEQLGELEKSYKGHYDDEKIEGYIIPDNKSRTDFVRKSDLFINATPVGMRHMKGCVIEKEALHDKLAVFDVIYNPRQTELIKWAHQKGLKDVKNGEGMLLHQGALSFKLWTGKEAPIEVMRKALEEKIASSPNY